MKNRKNSLTLIVIVMSLFSTPLMAHEGHDHVPGALKAIHGGVAKKGKNLNLEYMVSGSEVKFYPVTQKSENIPLNEVQITGTEQAPKGKALKLQINKSEDGFVTQVNFGNAYRLTLDLTVKFQNKTEAFKIQIENQ